LFFLPGGIRILISRCEIPSYFIEIHRKRKGRGAPLKTHFHPFSSPEAAILLVSTENHDLWRGPTPEVRDSRTFRYSAHALSQVWQIWLVLVSIYCVYKAIQNRNVVGLGQRSWFSVLTKRIAASGDENDFHPVRVRACSLPSTQFNLHYKNFWTINILNSLKNPVCNTEKIFFFYLGYLSRLKNRAADLAGCYEVCCKSLSTIKVLVYRYWIQHCEFEAVNEWDKTKEPSGLHVVVETIALCFFCFLLIICFSSHETIFSSFPSTVYMVLSFKTSLSLPFSHNPLRYWTESGKNMSKYMYSVVNMFPYVWSKRKLCLQV